MSKVYSNYIVEEFTENKVEVPEYEAIGEDNEPKEGYYADTDTRDGIPVYYRYTGSEEPDANMVIAHSQIKSERYLKDIRMYLKFFFILTIIGICLAVIGGVYLASTLSNPLY